MGCVGENCIEGYGLVCSCFWGVGSVLVVRGLLVGTCFVGPGR